MPKVAGWPLRAQVADVPFAPMVTAPSHSPMPVTLRRLAVIGLVVLLAGSAGCGGGDAATTTTTAAQELQAPSGQVQAAAIGDASLGRIVFETKCQICHKLSESEVGVGSRLPKAGLTAAAITAQVTKPRDSMPPNIVSGKDLNDVTAFVLTLQ